MVKLSVPMGKYTKIKTGKLDANASSIDGKYPFFTCSKEPLKISSYSYDCECVLVAGNGDLNVKYYFGRFDAYQRTYIIESIDKQILNPRYLYYFLDKYVDKLREQSIGGVIKYIKLGYLTEAQIYLLPLPVQLKIVDVLDRSSILIEKRKAQIDKLDLLIKSRFIEMFGDLVTNPMRWEINKLGECLVNIENGISPICESFPATIDKCGVLKLSAVTYGFYQSGENKQLLPDTAFNRKIEVKNKDLLLTRKNTYELVGMSAYVFSTRPGLMLPDLIFRLVPEESIQSIYLWQLINCDAFRNNVKSLAGGTAGSMPNISKKRLKSLEIPVPPLCLQNEFAVFVECVEAQKAQLKKSLTLLELNYKSLMQKCFRGELFDG